MQRPLAHLLLAGVLSLLAAAPSAAQEGGSGTPIHVPTEQFQLDNGLTVILHRDATTPTLATNIWYHAGSAREEPGRTGFAHLFEHIMFEGSKNVPEGKIDEWFEAVGGSPNGSTNQDRTNYLQSFSSSALELALFIESDRMGWLLDAMSPASVDGQRDVVKNERRQSYDNRPYGLASQLLTEATYPAGHPYSWPVIGYMDHLSAASYEDVVSFFRRYYAPNNASLAIAGDLDVAEARDLARTWFAEIPRGPALEPLSAEPPEIAEPRRILLEDRVQLPRLYLRWVTPAAFERDDAALVALGRVLSDGKNSRLYQRLVYELQIADDVTAFQRGMGLNGEFEIRATARSGHTLGELEAVILEELERIRSGAPDERELRRVLNQHETRFLEGLERPASKADRMNEYFFHTGTADGFEEDVARFRSLTPEAVRAAARRWLDPSARVSLSVVPRGRPELGLEGSRRVEHEHLELSPEARAAEGTAVGPGAEGSDAEDGVGDAGGGATRSQGAGDRRGEADAAGVAAAPGGAQEGPDRSSPPPVGPVPDLELPPIERVRLDNGAELLVVEKRDLPLVQVNLMVFAGSVEDPDGMPGTASLTADMMDEGAAGMDALEVADAFELLGARFGVDAGLHTASASLRVATPRLREALELMADVVVRPDFPADELERLRRERLTDLIRRHDEPYAIAAEAASSVLFGEEHPYGRSTSGTEASLRAVTPEDLRAFHRERWHPGDAVFVVVGDVSVAEARELVSDVFRDWEASEAGRTPVETRDQVTGRRIYVVDKPGSAQSVIRIGRIGAPRLTEDYYALEVMNTVLGGSFTSRLNQNLREEHGYSYGAGSDFDYRPAPGPWFASAAVQTDATGPALREFFHELEAIRDPIPAEELDRARSFLAMRYPRSFQSVGGIASRLEEMAAHGLPADDLEAYTERVLAVTRADAERVAREYVDPADVAVIVVGDREAVEPQIREQGLGEIVFLTVEDVLGPVPEVEGPGETGRKR